MIALALVRRAAKRRTSEGLAPVEGALGRTLRLAVVAVLVLMSVSAALGTPHPGLSGRGLGVTLALVVALASGLPLAIAPGGASPARLASILLLGLASAALSGFDPNSPGYVGAFLAAGAVTRQAPRTTAFAVVVVIVAAVTLGFALSGHVQPSSIVAIDLGVFFVAALALVAREQQRLVAELRETQEVREQAIALQERARLAREIHDVLAHSLTGLSVRLEGARMALTRDGAGEAMLQQIEQAQSLARSGLEETRRAVRALRGDPLPGPDQLAALVAEFGSDSGIPCSVEVAGEPLALSPEAGLALYRAAQEALTNIRKHATPDAVSLRLAWSAAAADLVILDRTDTPSADRSRGEGSAPAGTALDLSATGGGYGLSGIRERAELLGGTLEAGPTESGFRVHVRLPA